jgi:riboflavin synthase
MFTGIVEDLGTVVEFSVAEGAAQLTVRSALAVSGTGLGGSIAVNGCCLTVAERGEDWFRADLMAETLARTSLGRLRVGDRVNIERSLPADGRLAGHIVQGHVDGTGVLLAREPGSRWDVVRVGLPDGLARYVAPKGSIAIDGVSLTVVDVDDAGPEFTVSLIPETLTRTTLGSAVIGERLNLEVDVLAKYVERMLHAGPDARPDPGGSNDTAAWQEVGA